ncbi:MAG: sigma-54-dependent Fis family transcriptional regulator [Spirochaetales bacterium]|nr:sigma-54-dependent Fis family transcriptional regulator [Spirochaetales bacterium]
MKVLIADDEKNIRESLKRYLALEDIETICAENGLSARRHLEDTPFDAAVLDLKMPGFSGMELLQWIRCEGIDIPVIMISAHGEIHDAVEAMKTGAKDYIVKPFDPEELLIRLRRIAEEHILRRKVSAEIKKTDSGKQETKNQVMRDIYRMAEKIGGTRSTVLITGESGTGKEVLARRIHQLSQNPSGPFIPVNIGGLPETLVESELFGYEKGAFTGADRQKPGMFELATGGTIFLDEIGEIPPQLQVNLLRVLQDKRVRRLGGARDLPVDVRIIAATNVDLETRVREGKFREDLFYRLNIIRFHLPPLRDRLEDLPVIIGNLLKDLNLRMGKAIESVDGEAMAILHSYNFPGNIRELENLLERACIFAEGQALTAGDFKINLQSSVSGRAGSRPEPSGRALKDLERRAILDALHRWEGNRTKAAEELGISRRTIINKIREYGIV